MAENKVPEVTTPAEEKHPDGAPILKGVQSVAFWPTKEKAEEIAKGRVKGGRRAFSVKGKDGKERFATASNPHYLMEHVLCAELGYFVDEFGKPAREVVPPKADAIMAAINAMPNQKEREDLTKQLEGLLKAMKK